MSGVAIVFSLPGTADWLLIKINNKNKCSAMFLPPESKPKKEPLMIATTSFSFILLIIKRMKLLLLLFFFCYVFLCELVCKCGVSFLVRLSFFKSESFQYLSKGSSNPNFPVLINFNVTKAVIGFVSDATLKIEL